jgi:hypothetical protein
MASISESLIQGLLQPSLNFQNLQEPLGMILGGAQAQRAREERQKGLLSQAMGATDMNAFQRIIEQARTPEERQQALSAFNIGQQQRTAEREQKRQVANVLEQESELINARLAAQKIARSMGRPELADALKSAPMESVQKFIQASYEAQAKSNVPKVTSVAGGYTTVYPDGRVSFSKTEETEEDKPGPLDTPPDINATESKIIEDSNTAASQAGTRAAMAKRGLEILRNRGNVKGPFVKLRKAALGLFGSQDELVTAYQDVGSLFKDEALQAYLPRPGAISNFETQWAEQQAKDPAALNDTELEFFLNRKIDLEIARERYNQDKISHISRYGTVAGFNDTVMLKRSEQKLNELKKSEQFRIIANIRNNPNLNDSQKQQAEALVKQQRPDVAKYIDDVNTVMNDYRRYSESVELFESRFRKAGE